MLLTYNYILLSIMERSIDTLLQKSKLSKDKKLLLQCLRLDKIPDLSEFTWVEELNLGNNYISTIEKNKLPPNLTILNIYQNKLVDVKAEEIPETVHTLNVHSNFINIFNGTEFKNIKRLFINLNKLTDIKYPPNIELLDVSDNLLKTLDDFPPNLTDIDCSNNEIKKLPALNNKLLRIDFSHNSIKDFPDFPDGTTTIIGITNGCTVINKVPSSIEELNMKDNRINEIKCIFPPSLTNLNLCDNSLMIMPDLPTNIEQVDLSSNRIQIIKEIPESVKILDISDNCLTSIPDDLLKRNIKLIHDKNYTGSSDEDNECNDAFYSFAGILKPTNENNNTNINSDNKQSANLLAPITNSTYQPFSGTGYPLGNNSSHNYTNYFNKSNSLTNWHLDRWRSETMSIYSNTKAKKDNPNYVSIKNKKNIIV